MEKFKIPKLFYKKWFYRIVARSCVPSIRKIYLRCLIFLVLFFVTVYLGSSYYYFGILRNQMYQTMKSSMDLYNEQTFQNLNNTVTFLSEVCVENPDVSYLNITDNKNEIYHYTIKVKQFLSLSNITSKTGGMFLYFDSKQLFIPQISTSTRQSYYSATLCSEYLAQMMKTASREHTLDSLDYSGWKLYHIGNDYFLIRLIQRHDIYAGAWLNLENVSEAFSSFEEFGASFLFVNKTGLTINDNSFHNLHVTPEDTLTRPVYLHDRSKQKYMLITTKPAYCDYYIAALIPNEYLSGQLSPVIRIFLLLTGCLILFTTGLYFVMTRFFNAPVKMLQPALLALKQGQFDTKLSTNYPFSETQNLINVINDMISEIHNLRIRLYEDQLSKKELELQYLKTQIAPHFLINCLNTIFVLSQDSENLAASEKLIQTLSDHLRYTLSNRTYVPLSEEIHYVENYLEMTKLRFPGSLSATIHMDPDTADASVFPLLVLMLTENSIKTNIVMGELLTIEIYTELINTPSGPQMHIVHIDSGTGFDEKSMELFNHIMDHPEIRKNGYSIGIYNITSRLRLALGDNSTILFSNEFGKGARVDITFPYLGYTEQQETLTR